VLVVRIGLLRVVVVPVRICWKSVRTGMSVVEVPAVGRPDFAWKLRLKSPE